MHGRPTTPTLVGTQPGGELFNQKQGSAAACLVACKPHGNQPFTILKTRWKSKPDLNVAIALF